ncbi:MAG: NAD(P)H-hydrate dehydratase [Nitrospirae bacterium]|nr:NAD(P)H-hydrate dehydratase [Nitrospirota bacterium]
MKVVTSEEMREIDRKTIRDYGISGNVLMEMAGHAVAARIKELFKTGKVIVLSGAGNNGGDGIVAARNLHNWGWDVKVILLAKQSKLSPDCLSQYRIAKKIGIAFDFRKKISKKDLHGAIVIDAIFGTGLSKPVSGPIEKVISFVNKSESPVISVDIPSGISSDTGQILGEAVMADCTVTFGLPKRGHMLYPGFEFTGRLFIEDIGFPSGLLTSGRLKVELIEKKDASLLMPERPKYSNKTDYGHVLIIAGSKGKTGAALMCSRSCLRTGAGLVTVGVPESLMNIFQKRATEEMTMPLPDDGKGILSAKAIDNILEFSKKVDVITVGPGIGISDDTKKLARELILNSSVPLVIDADGINSIKDNIGILKKARSPVIITPHTGEMARLLQKTVQSLKFKVKSSEKLQTLNSELQTLIEKDRINIAINFAKKTKTYLVLKGAPTIIAEPEGSAFINTTGNPGMASAGVGDVLTGIIAGLLGQGLNPLEASILGVFMHGLAGDISAGKKGEHSMIASDIIKEIPSAFKALRS